MDHRRMYKAWKIGCTAGLEKKRKKEKKKKKGKAAGKDKLSKRAERNEQARACKEGRPGV